METRIEVAPIVKWAMGKGNDLQLMNLPVESRKEIDWCQRWCQNREWFSGKNEKAFYKNLKGLVLSIYNGFVSQARIYKGECYDIIDDDRKDMAIDVAKRAGFRQVKLFALAKPKGQSISIRGRGNFDWRIVPVEDHAHAIPVKHLETLMMLREEGLEFDGFGIAVPVQRALPVRDPVLLGRYGRYWIEIGRWE